jgi:Acetokinase family
VLVSELTNFETSRDAVARIGRFLADRSETQLFAVGHRVVHGGPTLRRHCVIDGAVLGKLERAAAFAPLHNLPALSVIRFAQENFPQLPQVACFDTAFHARLHDGVSSIHRKGPQSPSREHLNVRVHRGWEISPIGVIRFVQIKLWVCRLSLSGFCG